MAFDVQRKDGKWVAREPVEPVTKNRAGRRAVAQRATRDKNLRKVIERAQRGTP